MSRIFHSSARIVACLTAATFSTRSSAEVNTGLQKIRSATDVEIIVAAANAASIAVRSGEGTGRYREFEKTNSNWTLLTDATVDVVFAAPKYRLDLTYSNEGLSLNRRVIVFDGEGLLTSRFSEHISRTGAAGQSFPVRDLSRTDPQLAGFRWNVTKLHQTSLDIPKLIENLGMDRIQLNRTPNGDIKGEFRVGKSTRVTFICAKEFDYNLAEEVSNGPIENSQFVFNWQKNANGWYVQSIKEEINQTSGEKAWRWQFELDDLETNIEIQPQAFTFAALELPAGSRLLDYRTPTPEPHFVPYADDRVEASLQGLLDELKGLPTSSVRLRPAQRPSTLKMLLIGGNVVVILAIVFLLFVRSRRRNKSVGQ